MRSGERIRIAENLISEFKTKFRGEVGVDAIVTYSFKADNVPRVTLRELEGIVNGIFEKHFPEAYIKDGIRSKNRKSIIVTFRFIFFKVAREMFYPLVPIATYLGYNHATVLHAARTIQNLIDTNDLRVITYYNLIKNEIQIRTDNITNVSDTE